MSFIKKTNYQIDLAQVKKDLEFILTKCPWNWSNQEGIGNSIGLNHRPGAENQWTDNWGSLFNLKSPKKERLAYETDFSQWNDDLPEYTKTIVEELSRKEDFQLGRVRFLRLEKKTGLSIHQDFEARYHLAIKTNKFCFFGKTVKGREETAVCYSIPEDGYFYRANTTQEHFVYNGSWEDRIHLVICALEK